MSRRKAISVVKELKEIGLVRKQVRKVSKKYNKSNIYEVINPSECSALGSELDAPSNEQDASNKELYYKELDIKKQQYGTETEFQHYLPFNDIRPYLIEQGYYLSMIDYYMTKYKEHTGNQHREYTKEQWIGIADKFQDKVTVLNETDEEIYIELNKYMIDQYFKENLDCDRSIMHFLNPTILLNRWRNLPSKYQ